MVLKLRYKTFLMSRQRGRNPEYVRIDLVYSGVLPILTVTMPEVRSSLMSTNKGQKLFYLRVDSFTVMGTAQSDDGCCLSWCRA
jgi:hypothetical protein